MLQRHLDSELRELKSRILEMGGHVELSLQMVLDSLFQRKAELCEKSHEVEKRINQSHLEIDDFCWKLLARQSPVAGDLRFVMAAIKINTDLERMGDHIVNIAYNAHDLLSYSVKLDLSKLTSLAKYTQQMIGLCLDAFRKSDETLVTQMLEIEHQVDSLRDEIIEEETINMQGDPLRIRAGVALIQVARSFERLGDHATNIGEDVIFVISGKDVRHPKGSSGK